MGYPSSIFTNPYLMGLWKNLWTLTDRGQSANPLTRDDHYLISNLAGAGLAADTLPRHILKADRAVCYIKSVTLDKLCVALQKYQREKQSAWIIPSTWEEFAATQNRKIIYRDCEKIKATKIITTLLRNRISHCSRDNALQLMRVAKSDSPLPDTTSDEFNKKIVPASREDIDGIYELSKGLYELCPVNGPDVKVPWWKKNNRIFHVIHDSAGKVCATINLLPLRQSCYERLRQGDIDERGIKPDDIILLDEMDELAYLYIEGFACQPDSLAYRYIYGFDAILKTFVNNPNPTLIIGAIGGTTKGENLMDNLGFDIVVDGPDRLDKLPFFEAKYDDLRRNLYNVTG